MILLVGGCATGKGATAPGTPPPAVPSPADNNYVEGLALKRQGKYQQALELFAAAWKEEPGHPGVKENFPATLEELKESGDDAYWQGQLDEAGKRWAATMRFLSHPAAKADHPAISKAGLQGSIDKVSGILMEKGLADYREGRLEEAIATWRKILDYDPSHEEADRSVKTATTQLENLKKIPPPEPAK
jgi:tetratricopeptide (TPR) repeat protein